LKKEKAWYEQSKQVIIAYPPITRGMIKEELQQSDVNQDEFNVEEHQVL